MLLSLTSLLGLALYTRTWNRNDVLSYWGMSRECHPIWRDLFWRRIGPGQDVEAVIAETKPIQVERYGDFVNLTYQSGFTGIGITAKQGKLVAASAGSCCWSRTFFDEMTAADRKSYDDAYEAHWRPIREKQEAEEKAKP